MHGHSGLIMDPADGGKLKGKGTIGNIIESTTTFPTVQRGLSGLIESGISGTSKKKEDGVHSARPTKTQIALGTRRAPGASR